MKKTLKISILILVLLNTIANYSQETLNTNDINAYILGGDQNSNIATIDLQTLQLIDIESDPDNTIDFNSGLTDLEAGLPAMAASNDGVGINEDLWLNYSYRSLNNTINSIYVSTSHPVPNGVSLKVKIISVGLAGNFNKNPTMKSLKLNDVPKLLVGDISSGYTADGDFNGYQLQYSIENKSGKSLPTGFEILYEMKPQ